MLGPTGVGKTELAKALAEFLFDDEKALIRIDMSEFMEKHSVARLVGAPPGYVGYDEGGVLTNKVHRKPFSVILFDEVEKGHSDVYNLFLQLLDDGRLTDSRGTTVNFSNTIIIMTSNLGANNISPQETPEGIKEMNGKIMEAVHAFFRPEFINRLDDVVIFNQLQLGVMAKIVDIQIRRLKKYLGNKRITLDLKESGRQLLAVRGFNPAFGARPLQRTIQTLVQDPLAEKIIQGEIDNGDGITVEAKDEKLIITKIDTELQEESATDTENVSDVSSPEAEDGGEAAK